MVKSAQDVAGDDAAAALNGSATWGIFLQAQMGPYLVVIESVFLQDASKMASRSHPMMLIGDEPQSCPSYRDIAIRGHGLSQLSVGRSHNHDSRCRFLPNPSSLD